MSAAPYVSDSLSGVPPPPGGNEDLAHLQQAGAGQYEETETVRANVVPGTATPEERSDRILKAAATMKKGIRPGPKRSCMCGTCPKCENTARVAASRAAKAAMEQ